MNLIPGLYHSLLDDKYRFNIPLRAVIDSLPTQMSFGIHRINTNDVIVLYPSTLLDFVDYDFVHLHDVQIKQATPSIAMPNRVHIPFSARPGFKIKTRIFYVARRNYFEIYQDHKALLVVHPQYRALVM
ncbi:hypothetical protein IT409_01015 [Candidatus Falkowbacteria bacterium]|nr:hypothetical protein [Candidatus Falkowbacteria bacterium]